MVTLRQTFGGFVGVFFSWPVRNYLDFVVAESGGCRIICLRKNADVRVVYCFSNRTGGFNWLADAQVGWSNP